MLGNAKKEKKVQSHWNRYAAETYFYAKPVSSVFTCAVLALICKPIVRQWIDTFPPVSCKEFFHVSNSHRTPWKLAMSSIKFLFKDHHN
jgi:hypothetical protein